VESELMVEMTVDAPGAELAADRLWLAGATAVELREAGRCTTVAASFPTSDAARLVAGELVDEGATVVAPDPAWRDAWRQHAEPVEVGTGLLIAPGWRPVPLGSGRLVLSIDPGGCFGSGTHPSTRMILGALDRHPPSPADVALDVGSGSGILSVAAARLGAARVTAVDLDPEALSRTAANAEANGVRERVDLAGSSLPAVGGLFDLALVNITAAVHAQIGSEVTARVRPGGRILVAGLLPGQWRHVEVAYAPARVSDHFVLDGWEGYELVVPDFH
jgi:ribosomal protein L11 methyltransferase